MAFGPQFRWSAPSELKMIASTIILTRNEARTVQEAT